MPRPLSERWLPGSGWIPALPSTMHQLTSPVTPCPPLQIDPRPVPHSFFSDRSEFIPFGLSRMIVNGLHRIGMLDAQGYVTQDPRYTTKVRPDQLRPALAGSGTGAGT